MEWRSIKGFTDYEVSERGDVRRVVARFSRKAGKVLRGDTTADGYRRYMLTACDGARKLRPAHALVCEAFHGAKPTPSHEVAHYDGNRLNNDYRNLRWATRQENANDTARHGTKFGERSGRAKLTTQDVVAIRRRFNGEYGQIKALAEEYGLSPSAMRLVCHRVRWPHVT